jgi:polyferredoxin
MTKFHKPRGLIRYDAGHALNGVNGSLRPRRPRLVAYVLVLVALLGGLAFFARGAGRPEVTLLRGLGAPFEITGDRVRNQVRVKILNRSSTAEAYRLEVLGVAGAELVAPENPLKVAAGEQETASVFISVPLASLDRGSCTVTLTLRDEHGFDVRLAYRILGPTQTHV